ncbi:MAG: aminotransferase class I/II-fold pyridoxal phosphate-dependent enzyme [Deltaproteobacteria bacterium]|nr:aminotransferase class I/II-fold pyridoxal phosphate-dependent enzyme [Deltaproteobacteria bacterium]
MDIRPSSRIATISGYPFAEVDRMVDALRKKGVRPIDFGVGDPTDPTPALVRNALKEAADRHAASGYPSYVGSRKYRVAVAEWNLRRFGVSLDPDREICATIGSKEAVFNFPNALLEPGDLVLCPSPGYPPYNRGTVFAGGEPWFYPIRADNDYLPDLGAVPDDVLEKARLIWVNYPNSPTGCVAPDSFWPELLEFASRWDLVVASDEAYSEIWFDGPPRSILEFGREGVVVFQSLSKRSAMTGYRVGWVCGDSRVIDLFRKLKTNVDSGTADFIQDAAVAALSDEAHVEVMRASYRSKRDVLVEALRDVGCEVDVPAATLYVWPRAPVGMSGVDFAKRLLEPESAVVATPGAALGEALSDGSNPGADHVRFALVPPLEDVKAAAERIRAAFR